MRYREHINIIFMRDNGPRRSLRLRGSRFYLLIIFFSCLPFLCVLLSVQCWLLWDDNQQLRANVDRFEADYQAAEARAERLENFEELLREENVSAREVLARNLAASQAASPVSEPHQEIIPENMPEGPGHEEFPALDTGRVKVSNVQARAMRGNILRIGLDLRNAANGSFLTGVVEATLVASGGERYPLVFEPKDVGNFRINRFKRAVMSTSAPRGVSLIDSDVVLEVKDEAGEPIYRNIFPVQR